MRPPRRLLCSLGLLVATACASSSTPARSTTSSSTTTIQFSTIATTTTTTLPLAETLACSAPPPDTRGIPLAAVIVVQTDIPRGTSVRAALAAGQLACTSMPAEFRPSTAIVDVRGILDKEATLPLSKGLIVVENMFLSPQPSSSSS